MRKFVLLAISIVAATQCFNSDCEARVLVNQVCGVNA